MFKLRGKNGNFSKCFSVECLKLKLRFAKTGKSWLGVLLIEKIQSHELKFGVKDFRCSKRKVKVKKMFGLWVTPLVGRHVAKHG